MNDIKIFQAFHKSYPRNKGSSWVLPVGVSGYREEGFLTDDVGDNISRLNPYFCELTVLYWIWKNYKADIVGLYHYRRYLTYLPDNAMQNYKNLTQVDNNEQNLLYLTSESQLNALKRKLSVFEAIIPRKFTQLPSISTLYQQLHEPAPWQAFLRAIKRKYPNQSWAVDYFNTSNEMTVCNMFVTSWDIFDAYCEDLFDVTSEVFKEIGAPYTSWNNRYPGFLAERFLGFWLILKGLRTEEVPMVFL